MLHAKKLLLLATCIALLGPALPVAARPPACRAIAVHASGQVLMLRNSSDRAVSFALRFEGDSTPTRSCGLLSLDAGADTGRQTLASLCPAAGKDGAGTLKACRAPLVVHAHRGTATGDLLGDLQANNIAATGQ